MQSFLSRAHLRIDVFVRLMKVGDMVECTFRIRHLKKIRKKKEKKTIENSNKQTNKKTKDGEK